MTATSSTGLYQYARRPSTRLCVDCVLETIDANDGMVIADWQPASIDCFDAEHCDSCDCVPAAEIGKRTDLAGSCR